MRVTPAWSVDADAYFVRRQGRVATRFTGGREDATPGYAVFDLGASWAVAPRQSVRFALRNVGNRRYHDHLSEGLTGSELQAPGRSLMVSWQGEF